ncbi:MAG: sensor domain-containing diguanylate cyclase [Halomonas subglaciescola]|nr:sensor domain-containing diguanylate cyclase [Halomonas subglaciescola]
MPDLSPLLSSPVPRWLALCLLLIVFSLPALADPLNLYAGEPGYQLDSHTAYYHDSGGTLTLADIRQKTAAFTAVSAPEDLNFGYTASPTWLRTELANATGRTQRWMVVFAFPLIDRVTLYRVGKTASQRLESGSAMPVETRALGRRQMAFPLTLAAQEQITLYTRVETAGSKVLNYRLMTPEAFYTQNDQATFWLATYFGVLMALGLYHLMLFIGLKEQVFLHYALFLFSFTLAVLAFNGMGTLIFWNALANETARLVAAGFVLAAAMATRFAQSFLNTCLYCPRWHQALGRWRGACWIALIATLVLPTQPALRLMDACGLTTALLLLACATYTSWRRFPGAYAFMLGWSVLLAGAGVFALRNLGVLPANFVTLHGIQIGSALEMLLFALALASRFYQLKQQTEQAQAKVVTTLKSQEAVLERQVAVRTAALERMAHHDMLTGLLNRNGLEKCAQEALAHSARTQRPVALFMLDLDRFKPVNDEHGHAAGDFVLKQVANRLQHLTRPGDYCARFGGDEFIMLLENMDDTPAMLNEMHARISHAVRQPISLPESQQVSVGVSIGASVYCAVSGQHTSLEELLKKADGDMYAAKPRYLDGQLGRV